MKAKVGDWIMCKDGPALRLGVVRYVEQDSDHWTKGRDVYLCDGFRSKESDVVEVREG